MFYVKRKFISDSNSLKKYTTWIPERCLKDISYFSSKT